MTRLQTAIITSFSTGGMLTPHPDVAAVFAGCDKLLRKRCGGGASVGLDLYLAMEADLFQIAETIGRQPTQAARPLSVLDVLGRSLDPPQIERIARLYAEAIKNHCGLRRVVAISTFVPEISQFAEPGHDQAEPTPAEIALANILRIGRQIRKELPVPGEAGLVVEVVAGSLIKGLEPVSSRERFGAQMRGPDEVRTAVLQSLRSVIQQVLADREDSNDLPKIALELEPGPYFALKDESAIVEFSNAIVADPLLREHVGFNLDIAHWRIADVNIAPVRDKTGQNPKRDNRKRNGGMKTSSLADAPALASQVLHAHISGHHPSAHFGDCSIRQNEWESYTPMFEWLHEMADGQARHPHFSRTVSVELEAINRAEYVEKFYDDLLQHLN